MDEPASKKKREAGRRVTKRLSGAALASAIRVQARVELVRIRGESGPEHRAFLLWAMAGGFTYPNQRALLDAAAAAASVSASNLRIAVKNRRFAQRVAGFSRPDEAAYVTYRRMYLLDLTGREIIGIAAILDPPPDSIPELWRCSADRLAADIEARREERGAYRHGQFAAALADAEPIRAGWSGRHKHDPKMGSERVNLEAVKPAPSPGAVVAKLVSDDVGSVVATAAGKKPATRGASLDAKTRAVEAVARSAHRLVEREKKTGGRVVLTAQDARNVLRSIIGTPLDERTLREVDRELLAAARAAGPDAEVRLLSLLATQRAEAEAAAADPSDKLLKLIDASFGYFARELQAGRIKVTMSSLPMLIKARALLTGGATSRTEHTGLVDARALGVRDSARVADARQANDQGALVRAMREDVAELAVILDALGDANVEEESGPIDVESVPVTQAAGE